MLSALAALVQVYSLVLLARVILSWIPSANPTNPIVNIIHQLTEPIGESVTLATQAMPNPGIRCTGPITRPPAPVL